MIASLILLTIGLAAIATIVVVTVRPSFRWYPRTLIGSFAYCVLLPATAVGCTAFGVLSLILGW